MSRLPDRLPGRVDEPDANHLVSGGEFGLRRNDSYVPRDASRTDSPTTPAHIGRIALDRLTRLLSEREFAVIHSVATYRYLTGHQIEQLHFQGHATKDTAARTRRRVLERLVAGRFLDQLPRPIGGIRGGSGAYVFALGTVGYRVVHGEARRSGTPRDGGPSTTFLAHTLAVAQVGIDLTTAAEQDRIERVDIETEPSCWRSYQRGLGGMETLKPDLYAEVVTSEFEDRWLIEVDRATESLTAIRTKCQTYLDYYRTGIEQQRSQVFPQVLWSVPTDKRARQIEEVIRRMTSVPDGLFTVIVDTRTVEHILGGSS
jgi:hypothetical protein